MSDPKELRVDVSTPDAPAYRGQLVLSHNERQALERVLKGHATHEETNALRWQLGIGVESLLGAAFEAAGLVEKRG